MDYSISRQLPPQEAQLLNSRGFSNNGGLPPIETSHPLTLRDVLAAVKRRRKAALIFAGVVMGLVILYLCVATRRYAGDAILEFDKQNADMLALNGGTPAQQSDALDYNITLQTQVSILESDTLALRLFKELNLEETED